MRFACLLALVACIVWVDACGKQRRRNREIERGEGAKVRPQDALFINFQQNWRQLISKSPQMALPVIPPETTQPPPPPIVLPQCVFSSDAGSMVPQVTLIWNEAPAIIIERKRQQSQQQQQQQEPPALVRFDLALHQNAFARNYFSSALANETLRRFNLPPNSGLLGDTQAVLLTGPGLFPKLMAYKAETITDRDTSRQFQQQTMVLRDLNQGLTYTVRVSRFANNEWDGEQQFAFLAPVCPSAF